MTITLGHDHAVGLPNCLATLDVRLVRGRNRDPVSKNENDNSGTIIHLSFSGIECAELNGLLSI